ncbi:MAG: FmdE family protein [Desulfobacteraceae bacterium]|jgi:formylmethanofuran dehydrogenase subunit E-like metal-binding protein
MKPKNKAFSIILAVCFSFISSAAFTSATINNEVKQAMNSLNLSQNDDNLLVVTNAPYIKVNNASALPYLKIVQDITGCSVGKGNLLFFQRPQDSPLRMMLFGKTTGDAVIISLKDGRPVTDKVNLNSNIVSKPTFPKDFNSLYASKDLSSLALIASMWANDAPYDFVKSAELHNHICPGLTSGYLLARYLLDKYPLKAGESYKVISCPVWCKEDAFQVMLDCTPGKKGMIVKPLSEKQLQQVTVKNPAGIFLIWNGKKKSGRGVVLSFDFDRLRSLAPEGATKPAIVLAAVNYLNKPAQFVSVGTEFELTENLYDKIFETGVNPYDVLGLIKKGD